MIGPVRKLWRFALSGRADKYFGLASIGGVSLSRMLTAILIARLTDPTVFAVFVLLITVEIIGQTLLSALLVTPLVTIGPGLEPDARPSFVRFAVHRMVRFSILAGLFAVCAMPLTKLYGLDPWMYAGFCAYLTMWLFNKGLLGAMSCLFKRVVGFAGDAGRLTVPIVAVLVAADAEWSVLAAFFWTSAACNTLACLFMWKALPAAEGPVAAAVVNDYTRRGAHVLGGSIANSASSRVQPFVLGLANDPFAIALFGAANTFMGPVRILGCAIGDILQPRLALSLAPGGDRRKTQKALIGAGGFLGGVILVMALALLIAGEEIIDFVLGPQYVALIEVLPWACAFVVVASAVSIVVVLMQVVSLRGTAFASKLRIWVSVLSLLLVWPACALDGARGAYVAMLVAEVVYLLFALASLRSELRSSTSVAVI